MISRGLLVLTLLAAARADTHAPTGAPERIHVPSTIGR
jgi:hypothetical protein